VEILIDKNISGIVSDVIYFENKVRVVLTDSSFIDIFISPLRKNVFSFHWQRRDGSIYRLDTYPGEKRAKSLRTYPVHFHDGKHSNVTEPPFELGDSSFDNLEKFLRFILEKFTEDKI